MSSRRNWPSGIALLEQHHFFVQTHPQTSLTAQAMTTVEGAWARAHEAKAELVLDLASDVHGPENMHSLLVVLWFIES